MILYMLSKVFTSYTSYASDNIFEEELNLLIDIDSIEELYFIVSWEDMEYRVCMSDNIKDEDADNAYNVIQQFDYLIYTEFPRLFKQYPGKITLHHINKVIDIFERVRIHLKSMGHKRKVESEKIYVMNLVGEVVIM